MYTVSGSAWQDPADPPACESSADSSARASARALRPHSHTFRVFSGAVLSQGKASLIDPIIKRHNTPIPICKVQSSE